MEAIWDDLTSDEKTLETPAWHEDIHNGVIHAGPIISRQIAKYAEGEFHLHLLFGKDEVFSTGNASDKAHKLHSVNIPLRVVKQKYRLETNSRHAHEVVRKVFKAGSVWDYELVMKGQDETDTIVLYNASVLSDMSNLIKESQVEIKISDTGIGIPEENLSKIFDPFFTTKEVGKGTGLSMNVAYNIIKKHKGIIDVESTVGKGTTFTIRIPISQVEN